MQSVSLSIAFTLIFCLGSVAHASEPSDRGASEARRLYESGMKHYNVGEYKEALQSFKDAYFAKPDAVFLFNMGQCFRQLNQPADAAREYRAYLRESPDAPNRAEVERLISAAEDQVRQQNATAPPTGILPAGSKASAQSAAPASPRRTASASSAALVALPSPAPAAERRRRPTWVWVVIGAAAAVVIAGAAVGIAYAVPKNASAPNGTDGSHAVSFP